MKTNLPLPPFEEVFGSKVRIKILKILAQKEELTISLIIQETRLNYASVVNHLDYLKEIGLVQEKRFGRIRIFRYRIENVKARSLAKFINIWETVE